jgi:hypothetical protein
MKNVYFFLQVTAISQSIIKYVLQPLSATLIFIQKYIFADFSQNICINN